MTGHHSGPAVGADAAGLDVDFWGISLITVEDGRVVEAWNCFDMLCMDQQIGWVANPPLPPRVSRGGVLPSGL